MLLVILIIMLILLCLFEYRHYGKELCSPVILFLFPMIIACVIALFFSKEWYFTLHINTFFTILLGCISLSLGATFAKKVKISSSTHKFSDVYIKKIELWKYVVFLLAEIVFYGWKLLLVIKYANSHGSGGSIAQAINYYNYILKFTNENGISTPTLLSLGMGMCTAIGFIWATILARDLNKKNKRDNHTILTLINLLVCIIGSMSSGGRGGAVQLISSFIVAYFFFYYKTHKWKVKVPYKIILKIAILVVVVVYAFFGTMSLIGREEIKYLSVYFSNYIGAEIHNLDYFLNYGYNHSVIWGQETFRPIIMYFSGKLGITEWANYKLDIPSVYIKTRTFSRISLGNVSTTFYAFVHDFGILGVPPLSALIGFISGLSYKYAKNSDNSWKQILAVAIYSNIAYSLLFSFFSNKFYELIFTPDMVRKIIWYLIILVFLFRVKFNYKHISRG